MEIIERAILGMINGLCSARFLRANHHIKDPLATERGAIKAALDSAELVDANFKDPELSLAIRYGTMTLSIFESLAFYIHLRVDEIRQRSAGQAQSKMSRASQNTQLAADLREWLSFSERAKSLLSDYKLWHTRGLPHSKLHLTSCPLCCQRIPKKRKIEAYSFVDC